MNTRLPHVLMTVDTEGGVWTYGLELVRACRPLGIRFTVAVLGRAPSDAALAEMTSTGADVCSLPCRLEWMPDADADVERSAEWLSALAARIHPDVVQINGYAHAGLFSSPTIVVAHSCVCSWWRAVHGCAAPPEWTQYRARVRTALDTAVRVIAPTRAMLDALEREHGRVEHGHVIWNGLDAEDIAVRKEDFIFAAGRLWDEAKNLEALDRIASRVIWPIVAAGSVTRPDGGEQPAAAIRSLGSVERQAVREWMQRAAIYAWPVLYEPFGLSVLEAAHAGCVLVLSDIPSLRELWSGAATLVPPGDDAALARALNELATQPQARASMADRARARARAYSTARFGAEYARLYREVIGNDRSRAALSSTDSAAARMTRG